MSELVAGRKRWVLPLGDTVISFLSFISFYLSILVLKALIAVCRGT